ncbi:TolC family protein [Chitinophaga horti]|uniref:TolC family protein n=1 Tax=Chitinophaga horti TaxID=2920382 RepID=A0ABY6IZE8_9BACT|nr:TolC family protein [Chitinophaga horti]UYQ92750.1 TolC family protein [Chitinophaga horti]
MKRLKLSLALLLGIGVYNGHAQTKLSLKETLQYALANNHKLAQTRMEEDLGRLKTAEIRAQALPQINANGNLTDNIIKPVFVLPGDALGQPGKMLTVESGTTWNTGIGADLSQQIFNQSVFTGLKAAKSGEEYYAMQTVQSEENVIYQVSQMYYNLLVSQERMSVLQSNIDKLTKLVQTTQTQFENGLAKRIDLDRIKVNLVNYKTQKSQLENQLRTQTNSLKSYLGMPLETQLDLPAIELSELANKASGNVDYGNFIVENRTEFKLLKKQEELQNYQKKAYQAEYYPSLSLSANYSYNGISDKFDIYKSGGTAFWYDMASVALKLRIPIFDGYARRSKVNQANVTLRQINRMQADTKLQLNSAFENAKLNMANNLATIQTQKENMQLADEVYSTTQSNYNLGLANLTDLLNAETSLTEAQNSYNQALLEYKLAELELIKSNGNLKTLLN